MRSNVRVSWEGLRVSFGLELFKLARCLAPASVPPCQVLPWGCNSLSDTVGLMAGSPKSRPPWPGDGHGMARYRTRSTPAFVTRSIRYAAASRRVQPDALRGMRTGDSTGQARSGPGRTPLRPLPTADRCGAAAFQALQPPREQGQPAALTAHGPHPPTVIRRG